MSAFFTSFTYPEVKDRPEVKNRGSISCVNKNNANDGSYSRNKLARSPCSIRKLES